MVSPISNVRFCGEAAASNILERDGAYARPKTETSAASTGAPVEEKKSGHKFLKTIAGLVVAAAALVALPKIFPNAVKVLSKAELEAKPGFMKKIGHYVAKTGETIGKYTYEPIVKLFKGKKADTKNVDSSIFA